MNTMTEITNLNGVNTEVLRGAIDAIAQDPALGMTHWSVSTHWRGGARSDTRVTECIIGGKRVPKNFTLGVDEPLELLGTNEYPNPQEYLLAGLNACMVATFINYCELAGIEVEELRIDTEGDIDLRGLLGIDPTVKPGYDHLRYTLHVKGNATPEQFEQIHCTMMATSPNYFNLASEVALKSRLVVE